ncbi:MAG: cytochrome-c peroxidase [Halomonas sp.]
MDRYRQGQWPSFSVAEGVDAEPLGRLPAPALPAWQTTAVEELGKQLFFDPRLSGSGQLACASCHDPDLGWGDGRATSFGHDRQRGTRNAMTLLNVAYFDSFFWDGRASSLEEQALLPIEDPIEMAADLDTVLETLNAIPAYREAFQRALGTPSVTASALGKALAAFQRTLISRPSRFDRFLEGKASLDDQEIEGLHLFRTKARCMNCHHGPLFSDGRFHNIGLALVGSRHEDLGRFSITGQEEDKGAFRTPSLRDLTYTTPWMHNGLFVNLRGTLAAYNQGMQQGHRGGQPEMSDLIEPLGLSHEELDALEAFLHSLSRRPARVHPPALPPSPKKTP